MRTKHTRILRVGAMLAINLHFLIIWGFTGMAKLWNGMPPWFGDKFGKTVLVSFPGLSASFWILALSESTAFLLAAIAMLRAEFLERRPPLFLALSLVMSLFVFTELAFGQWLTSDSTATAQLFIYFAGTLISLQFVAPGLWTSASSSVNDKPRA